MNRRTKTEGRKKLKMTKKSNMFNIHFKTAFDYVRRAPFQAMSAVFVLAITFFVTTIIALLIYSSGKVIEYFQTRPQVIAFLNDEATEDQISSLKTALENDIRLTNVKHVTKEEALEIYKKATVEKPLLSELVSPDIFPASLEFSLKDLTFAESVIDEIKEKEIVSDVGFTANIGGDEEIKDVVNRLRNITWYVKVGGGVFVGILLVTSFLVLLVIISMRITTRRGEVEILNLLGASSGFIRTPLIIEAFIYSTLGVVLGWTFALISILYITPSLVSYFGEIPVVPGSTNEMLAIFMIILGVELALGLMLGLFGCLLAVARAKPRKK
jgi:cell division transport system permease protein